MKDLRSGEQVEVHATSSSRRGCANDAKTEDTSDDAHAIGRATSRTDRHRPRGRRCAAGSTAAATTAASCSSTCATPPGIVQVVVDPDDARRRGRAPRARRVGACASTGRCGRGPRARSTPTLPTGDVEVGATALEVLNEAEPPPFPLDDRIDVDEVLRLRHRYLDLRRPRDAAQPPRPRAR